MEDRTELVVVLDRSGSMDARRADHEGGLRAFIRDQRNLAGDVRLTFVRFDSHDPFELVYDGAPLAEVDEACLELIPRGDTPLLDALGQTLAHVSKRQAANKETPDMTVVMVITDGQENASRTWTKGQIKDLVQKQEARGWKVLYLGANVDEFDEAGSIGIGTQASLGYVPTAEGVQKMYGALMSNLLGARSTYRGSGSLTQAYANLTFAQEQRTAAKKETTDASVSGNSGSETDSKAGV